MRAIGRRVAIVAAVLLAVGAAKPLPPLPPVRLSTVFELQDRSLRLELVHDARITPATQTELENTHWFGIARSRRMEELLAARPMVDAVLRLVTEQGRVTLQATLDTPFATLQRLPPQFAGHDVFLLTSHQGGVGQDILAVGQVLTAEPGRLQAVGAIADDGTMEAIRLLRGGRTRWRILAGEAGGGAILQAQCVVDVQIKDGFREVLTTYHATAQGWRLRRRETIGWCDWPNGFPPVLAFP